MKVILCCLVLFILLACPVSAVISPIPAATKVAIAIPTVTPKPTLEIAGLRTLQTTTTPAQHTFYIFKMTSNPSGARVFVMGNATDTFTPWVEMIPDNYHMPYPLVFVLKYPGYEDYIFEPVTFAGENITLHADMIPLPGNNTVSNQSGYRSSVNRYNPPESGNNPAVHPGTGCSHRYTGTGHRILRLSFGHNNTLRCRDFYR